MGSGEPRAVEAVRIKNVKTGKVTTRKVDGVFIAIGHAPATELFKGQLEMKPSGYLITTPDSTATSIPGVFAAGDVKDDVYRQADAEGFIRLNALRLRIRSLLRA